MKFRRCLPAGTLLAIAATGAIAESSARADEAPWTPGIRVGAERVLKERWTKAKVGPFALPSFRRMPPLGSTIHLSQGCEITTFDLHGTVLSRRSLCDKLAGASLTALFPVEVSGDDASEYVLDHDLSMNATQVVSHDGALMWKADSRERFKSTYGDLDGDGRTEFVRAGYKWIEALDNDGKRLWIDSTWTDQFFNVHAGDVDGDGKAEVVVGAIQDHWVYSGHGVRLRRIGKGEERDMRQSRLVEHPSSPDRVALLEFTTHSVQETFTRVGLAPQDLRWTDLGSGEVIREIHGPVGDHVLSCVIAPSRGGERLIFIAAGAAHVTRSTHDKLLAGENLSSEDDRDMVDAPRSTRVYVYGAENALLYQETLPGIAVAVETAPSAGGQAALVVMQKGDIWKYTYTGDVSALPQRTND